MTNAKTDFRSLLTLLLVSCAASACHDSHLQSVGSESHFLELCEHDAECGDLSCMTGVCTRACADDAECSALSGDAECRKERCAAPVENAEPTPVHVDGRTSGAAGAVAPSMNTDTNTNTNRSVPTDTAPSEAGPRTPIVLNGSGQCGQQSGFDGDEMCLLPPSPDEGIQIHIGPNSYDDQAELAPWLLQPGDEVTKCWTFQMPDEDFAFAEWELSERPGMHHAINLLDMSDGRFDVCMQSLGAESATAVPDQLIAMQEPVARVPAAPENAAIARRIPGGAPAGTWIHALNYTDKPMVIEVWLNLYKPRAQPTQYDAPLLIGPGTNIKVDPAAENIEHFACPIKTTAGRLLSLSTLTLPSTRTVDAWLVRADGESIQLLHRPDLDASMDQFFLPTTFRFDSVTMNPPIAEATPGGFSGQVEFKAGDVLEWQCDIAAPADSDPLAPNLCDLSGSATVAIECDTADF